MRLERSPQRLKECRLFHGTNCTTEWKFLIDTVAQFSVLPATRNKVCGCATGVWSAIAWSYPNRLRQSDRITLRDASPHNHYRRDVIVTSERSARAPYSRCLYTTAARLFTGRSANDIQPRRRSAAAAHARDGEQRCRAEQRKVAPYANIRPFGALTGKAVSFRHFLPSLRSVRRL
ncbi:hypothetical protein HPB50_017311 [Hyalomma asiaticum]|uniref:Uncharacterized protein n=1 Tax=Hyalomma asiaticum TaxID=266040 RepID=A0ACB7TLS1_HYAAI|nr:hypothetical protein HPB50_017311 [Hyalomma asiaticum]